MVANQRVERPDSMDYLVNKITELEQQVAELTAQSKFPFSVSHGATRDFSILPSVSGDGSADLYMGNGVGGPLLQVFTDSTYHQKIAVLRDMSGAEMVSTDAATGFGLGNPVLPFPVGGFESLNMSASTNPGSAVEVCSGRNFVYNPVLWVKPRVRVASGTANTVNLFAVFTGPTTTYTTGERTISVSAGVNVAYPDFAVYLAAADMKGMVNVAIRAYCSAGTPANVTVTASHFQGSGVSKGFADLSLQAAL